MTFDSIQREIHVEASPEVVYEVISTPEHLRQWWPDDAQFEPLPGATGSISFGDRSTPAAKVVPIAVLEADPPRRFRFRWAYDAGEAPTSVNSMLVTFELLPSAGGTLLRFTESGFEARGWDRAVLEQQYRNHATGWDHFLPRLVSYIGRLVSTP
jgi:uncharacterized protein YndB with AHSA1/START domain